MSQSTEIPKNLSRKHDHQRIEPHNLNYTSSSSMTNNNSLSKIENQSRFSQWMCNWVTDWWGAEIACWVIASTSLAAVVIVLENYKDEPLPDWPFGITLNALISILATIAQMAMMKPVIECLSQLKWLWFVRRRNLLHFQALEDASRGPAGSLMLFGKIKDFLILLGAVIAILSIAFGTFAQQVITFSSRLHPDGKAFTPIVLNFTGIGDLTTRTSPGTQAALYSGLYNNNLNLSNLIPSCSTGNCTWDIYPSLAVCASVIDLSSEISNNDCNLAVLNGFFKAAALNNPGYPCINYTLPFHSNNEVIKDHGEILSVGNPALSNAAPLNPLSLGAGMQILTLTSGPGTSKSSIITSYIVYQPHLKSSINSTLVRPVAYGLTLDLCVQKYNTTVSNGVTSTSVVWSQPLGNATLDTELPDLVFEGFGNSTSLAIDGFNFAITGQGIADLAASIGGFFMDNCYQLLSKSRGDVSGMNQDGQYCTFGVAQDFLNSVQSSNPLSALDGLMQNYAISITNMFRAANNENTQGIQFPGIAFAPQTYVGTNYLWLIFPITLVLLTFIFLLATILKSQRLGSRVWKSSTLATMQGFHNDLHAHLGGLTSIGDMEEKAKSVQVRFNMEGGKAQHGAEYRLVESKRAESWK